VKTKPRTRILLVVFVVIAALGAIELFTGPTLVHQLINMRHARQHLPVVRQQLDAVPEFRQLRAEVYTGSGGTLLIEGQLPSEADADRARAIIEATKPPVTVKYWIDITNGDQYTRYTR
jgi:hypothetical protein